MTKRIVTTVVMAGLLAGCATPGALVSAPAASNVGAQAAAAKFLTTNKAGADAKQTTKNKLGNKADSKALKDATELKVTIASGSLSGNSYISDQARVTLRSMQQAQSYDSACQIAYGALERMLDDTNNADMVVRFTYYGAKSQEKWVNAYKVAALGMEHIANGRSSTGRPAYNLALNMMATTDSWVDGAKVGYEMLETVEKADRDSQNRRIASYAYDSAKRASRWEDAYRTLENAFREIANRSY